MKARRVSAWSAAFVVMAACTPHPVGPARTFGKYEGKAVTTAESALSAVETVRLAVKTAGRGHGTGPFPSEVFSDQEESLTGVEGTFLSIQPPDQRAVELMDQLDRILGDATYHVTGVRVAVRRGDFASLGALEPPLKTDSDALQKFIREHQQ